MSGRVSGRMSGKMPALGGGIRGGGARGSGVRGFTLSIRDDPDLLQGDEAFLEEAIEHGKEVGDLFLAVHDLDDYGKVLAQSQKLGAVNLAVGAEAEQPSQDGRAGQAPTARFLNDGLERGPVAVFIAFADEDAKELGFRRH